MKTRLHRLGQRLLLPLILMLSVLPVRAAGSNRHQFIQTIDAIVLNGEANLGEQVQLEQERLPMSHKRLTLARKLMAVGAVASGMVAMFNLSTYSAIEQRVSLELNSMSPTELEVAKLELNRAYRNLMLSHASTATISLCFLLLSMNEMNAYEKLIKDRLIERSSHINIDVKDAISLNKNSYYLAIRDTERDEVVEFLVLRSTQGATSISKKLISRVDSKIFGSGFFYSEIDRKGPSLAISKSSFFKTSASSKVELEKGIYLIAGGRTK